MGDIRSVLFVCSGNSCRSVMAEGFFKKHLAGTGKGHVKVTSAGTIAAPGWHPTAETIEVMAEAGVDVSRHRSCQLTDEMVAESDLILVMEYAHRDAIVRRMPEAEVKTFLIREYEAGDDLDYREGVTIPDPIGRPMAYYEYCANIINKETERIAKLV